MRTRFPIYTKVLILFMLNLLLIGGAILVVMRTQLAKEMDTLLGRAVAVRIIEICQELRTEVESGATTWDEALAEAKAAYDVEFHLFSVRDWTQVAGEPVTIPEAVKNEFRSQRPRETNAPAMRPRPGGRRGAGPPVDRIVLARTDDPTTYWFGMRLALNSDDLETRGPGVLYARTSALFGTGVLIDVRPWMFLAAGILVGSALLWLPLVRDLTSSVKQMTNATEKIADGRFDIELDEHRRDELGRLGVAINRMSHRLAGFVDGQKRFMGDTAHELTAPLARMQLALGILEQRVGADSQPYVRGVHEELDLMTNLVNELMSLTKAGIAREAVKLSRVELRPLIEAIITRECPDSQKVMLKLPESLAVMGDSDLLSRAVANIIRNSVRYSGEKNVISVDARADKDMVELAIEDTGPGVPEEDLPQLFDPFYRVDQVRTPGQGGTGLGLAIVQTCITACGGTVTAENVRPHGLRIKIALPGVTPRRQE